MRSDAEPPEHGDWFESGCVDVTCSGQASAEHFEQCAEFPLLRNRGLGPLAVTVLPIPLASRATATGCAAVQSAASCPFGGAEKTSVAAQANRTL
jgi:hypothetical protein